MKKSSSKLQLLVGEFDPAATPPTITPADDRVARPKWSVMIPTFNCAQYLRQTLESVLLQDFGPEQMQIEVIDDCSTKDDPESVVREFGRGRVTFYRKDKNAGAIANFNTCIERSRGELVHILHGDDYVLPGFYHLLENTFSNDPTLSGCATRSITVLENGWIDYLTPAPTPSISPIQIPPSLLYYENWIRTPAVIVHRSFYEKHGGFRTDLVHAADWEMWVRVAANGGLGFVNSPLAAYRFFAGNDTGRLMKSGENIRDFIRAAYVFQCNDTKFDGAIFSKYTMEFLFQQYRRFLKLPDPEAALANKKLMMQISKKYFYLRSLNEILSLLFSKGFGRATRQNYL